MELQAENRRAPALLRGLEVALFFGLLAGAAVLTHAEAIAFALPRSVLPVVVVVLSAAVLARVALIRRPLPLIALKALLCPTCRYSLDGLGLPGICPECGRGYYGHSIGCHRVAFDPGATRRMLLALAGILAGIAVPLVVLGLRESASGEPANSFAQHSSSVSASLFFPHALCSAVVGKHFGRRSFRGFWIGGVAVGALSASVAFAVGGAELVQYRLGSLPIPGACTALGLLVGSLGGFGFLALSRPRKTA